MRVLKTHTTRTEAGGTYLILGWVLWRDANRGNLPAAAGYVGQAGSAETRQIAGEFSAKKIRREVHQHIAELHLAARRYVGKHFASDGNAFLYDPASSDGFGALARSSRLDAGVPRAFTGFPAESHSGTAVFVARFQNQVLALRAHKREQIDRFSVVRRAHIRDH